MVNRAFLLLFWIHLFLCLPELDLVSRFSDYKFSPGLDVKAGDRFLCPTTFLTGQRTILHERILNAVLKYPVEKENPSLVLVIGASGSGKSHLISFLRGRTLTCPDTTSQNSLTDFLFDYPTKMEGSFEVNIPLDALVVSGDSMMEKLPEYVAYKRWLDSRPEGNRTIYIDVANSCHVEAAQLGQSVALSAVESRFDLVFEGTGQRTAFLFELATLARDHGYRIHLIHVNTDLETCSRQAANRFEETGRGVPLDVVKRSFLLSRRTFRQVAPLTDFSSVWKDMQCQIGFAQL